MRHRTSPARKELPIQTLNCARNLFSQKGWPLEGCLGEKYFEEFCNLLQGLSILERNMILTLSEDFLWVQDVEYVRYFSIAFDDFVSHLDNQTSKTIIIAPLLPEEDIGKPKSSVCLVYLIKCALPAFRSKYKLHNIVLQDNPLTFDASSFSSNSILCLVDDFIGCGETAIKGIQYYTRKAIPPSNIIVLSLVAMQEGINFANKNGHSVYSSIIQQKAITGRLDGNEESFRSAMQNIELRIKVLDDFRFGYANSEALVRMMRTPNNTFPIYWLRNRQNPHPPFPR